MVLKEHAANIAENALPAPQTSSLHQFDREPEAARRGGLAVKCSICSGSSLSAAEQQLLHSVAMMCKKSSDKGWLKYCPMPETIAKAAPTASNASAH